VAVLLFAGIAGFHREIVPGTLYALGRARGCDWRGSLAALTLYERQFTLREEIGREISLVRTEGALGLWKTPDGETWFPSSSKLALAADLAEQRRGIYGPFGLGAKAGDIVLDCGANAGLYVRTALGAGASKVIAIEPVPDNMECLRRNLSREIAAGRVVLVTKGVWDKEDSLEISLDRDNAAADSFVIERSGGKLKLRLPLTTIDRIVAELNLPRVDYIKMDIEGAERRALDGARQTIRKYHPHMALCVYHLPDDPPMIDARVAKMWAGYRRSCGPCWLAQSRLMPEVYFYY
jgi:FkbM family methyltransferase